MSFFVDDFFDELDKGSLEEAKLLAEKWDEIFLRKELWQNAEVLEKEESSEKEADSESEENSSQPDTAENQKLDDESDTMSDEDLKIAVAATMLKKSVFNIMDWFNGKDSDTFKSGDAQIAVSGTEEDNIEVCYKKGNAELEFYFNGDDLGIDELEETDDEYDTGIYIFQKLRMALRIDGKTEIEFLRIRKKDRHAIRENNLTLTEFLENISADFPESFAEHALRFMQRLMKIAYTDRRKKSNAENTEQTEADAKYENEDELHRKEEMLAGI